MIATFEPYVRLTGKEAIGDIDSFFLSHFLACDGNITFDISSLSRKDKDLRRYFRRLPRYLKGVIVVDAGRTLGEPNDGFDRPCEIERILAGDKETFSFYSKRSGYQLSSTSPVDIYALSVAKDAQLRDWAGRHQLKETFGDEEYIEKLLNVLTYCDQKSILKLFKSQKYQPHLGHIRVLQNLHLVESLGLNIKDVTGKAVMEYGPGLGGFYPLAIASEAAVVDVVDKNPAVRLMAMLRGASCVKEMLIGDNAAFPVEREYDFVIGVGLLNIFKFDSADTYERFVEFVTGQIRPGGIGGVWVTYDQDRNLKNKALSGAEINASLRVRDAVFRRYGWRKREIDSLDSRRIGLDYNYTDQFAVFTKNL